MIYSIRMPLQGRKLNVCLYEIRKPSREHTVTRTQTSKAPPLTWQYTAKSLRHIDCLNQQITGSLRHIGSSTPLRGNIRPSHLSTGCGCTYPQECTKTHCWVIQSTGMWTSLHGGISSSTSSYFVPIDIWMTTDQGSKQRSSCKHGACNIFYTLQTNFENISSWV